MTLTFEFDLDSAKLNQHARYIGKGRLVQKLLPGHTHTHTHIGLIALPGPLHVKCLMKTQKTILEIMAAL